jgi:Xaa-Pro aminopeptidase
VKHQEDAAGRTEIPPGLVRAQALARAVVAELEPFVQVGVTEIELDEQLTRIALAGGSTGFWSPSTTRVGLGTLVAHPDFPMQHRPAVAGDTVIIDIACSLAGWCGDFCTTLTLEAADETLALVDECRWVYDRLLEEIRPGMPACQLYEFGAGLLRSRDLKLLDLLDNFGHSIGREFAADGFIDATNSTPMWGGWTLEPHVGRHARGAKFEEIVWLAADGSVTVV